MQSVSSRIWTRIAAFISYGDNDYTTGTSMGYLGATLIQVFMRVRGTRIAAFISYGDNDYTTGTSMGYLGATLTQVFMRVRGADMSLRDITIAQMGIGA